jgi:hypothetical protein
VFIAHSVIRVAVSLTECAINTKCTLTSSEQGRAGQSRPPDPRTVTFHVGRPQNTMPYIVPRVRNGLHSSQFMDMKPRGRESPQFIADPAGPADGMQAKLLRLIRSSPAQRARPPSRASGARRDRGQAAARGETAQVAGKKRRRAPGQKGAAERYPGGGSGRSRRGTRLLRVRRVEDAHVTYFVIFEENAAHGLVAGLSTVARPAHHVQPNRPAGPCGPNRQDGAVCAHHRGRLVWVALVDAAHHLLSFECRPRRCGAR